MKVQPAAFLRTTLPLGIDMAAQYDSGRYHSIWLPDHMVSFWPDSIWTPEFTDLALSSPSPYRHLDGMAVAAAKNIHWLLTDRLKVFEGFKRFALAEEVIDRPMFATGEPRSGTTLMHALMSVDPDARALR